MMFKGLVASFGIVALAGWFCLPLGALPGPGAVEKEGAATSSPRLSDSTDQLGLPPGPVLAWAERQSCHGSNPSILLRWTPAENSLSTYTIERLDGGYFASVDTASEGFAHLVTTGLEFTESYSFRVVAHNNFDSTLSNTVTTYVVNEECIAAGVVPQRPGPFISWLEPVSCQDGSVAVEIHWSVAGGADSYTVERFAPSEGNDRIVTGLQGTTFLDDSGIVAGLQHYYLVTAENAHGTSGAQFSLPFRPRPDLCGDEGLPGSFQVSAGAPSCSGSVPAIPIEWTSSSGADSRYEYRVVGQKGLAEGEKVNTDTYGFSFDATRGVRVDQVHELFMVAKDATDASKRRHSNAVFVAIPPNYCSPASLPPEVYTQPANGITPSSVVLRSQVKANGSPTFAYFEWGKTVPYTDLTSVVAVGSAPRLFQKPSRQRTGLDCETEYHYRVVAWNDFGTSSGEDRVFTTSACPACGQNDLTLSGLTVSTQENYEACERIIVGPDVYVESGGSLDLKAPLVVLGNGFSVANGGSLRVGEGL